MVTSVYLRRLEPALYEGKGSESVGPADNFYVQMTARLARVVDLLTRTRLVYKSAGKIKRGGVHVVVGVTSLQDPYLFSVFGHDRNEIGGVELGMFSSDPDFVDSVRSRMETGLPPWIEAGKTHDLRLWHMEDVYAIVSGRKPLVN